ncbi:MAG: hypothetical protein RIT25_1223 [Planctomycetota bacterium]
MTHNSLHPFAGAALGLAFLLATSCGSGESSSATGGGNGGGGNGGGTTYALSLQPANQSAHTFSVTPGTTTPDQFAQVQLRNAGTTTVDVQTQSTANWLQVTSFNGAQVGVQEARNCAMTLVGQQVQQLAEGQYSGQVRFLIDAAIYATFTVNLTVDVPTGGGGGGGGTPTYALTLLPSAQSTHSATPIVGGIIPDQYASVTVRNDSTVAVDVTATTNANWLSITSFPNTGIAPAASRQCALTLTGQAMQALTVGEHRAAVAFAVNSSTLATFEVLLTVNSAQESGWTVLNPSTDTIRIHVSASGNDANDGRTEQTPKRTLAAGYAALRAGYPDWLLLKRGDTWTGQTLVWNKSGRSAAEPIVMAAYGDGARPRIRHNQGTTALAHYNGSTVMRHVWFMNLDIEPASYDGSTNTVGLCLLGPCQDILVEDVRFRGNSDNLVIQAVGGRHDNFRMRRCQILDAHCNGFAHSQGGFFSYVDNLLIEECLFDMNGWLEGVSYANATIFNHNIYIQYDCGPATVRRCILANSSATGAMMRSAGVCEDNLILRNPVGVLMGTAGTTAAANFRAVARNNVLLDARDINASTPRGMGITIEGTRDSIVEGNLIAHQVTGNMHWAFWIGASSSVPITNLRIANNTVYSWGSSVKMHNTAFMTGTVIESNTFQEVDGKPVTQATQAFPHVSRNNRYYSTRPVGEWVQLDSQGYVSLSSWLTSVNDTTSQSVLVQMPAPNRDVTTYNQQVRGSSGGLNGFLQDARTMRKGTWRNELTAPAVNAWVRAGYGM